MGAPEVLTMVIVMRSISCLSRVLCCLNGLCLFARAGLLFIGVIIIIGGWVVCARAPADITSQSAPEGGREMIYLLASVWAGLD